MCTCILSARNTLSQFRMDVSGDSSTNEQQQTNPHTTTAIYMAIYYAAVLETTGKVPTESISLLVLLVVMETIPQQ